MSRKTGDGAPRAEDATVVKRTDVDDTSPDVEASARLAELVADVRRRRAQRQADRAEFARRREHGLKARHAAKLRHLNERENG